MATEELTEGKIIEVTLVDGSAALGILEVSLDESGDRKVIIKIAGPEEQAPPKLYKRISVLELMAYAAAGHDIPKIKRTPFGIGQRWRCQEKRDPGRPAFDFVIVGHGSTPRRKLCRLEPLTEHDQNMTPFRQRKDEPLIAEYSHSHIQKCAKRVETK